MPDGVVSLAVDFVKESAAAGAYELSLHADTERLADGLSVSDLEDAMMAAELLEDYPDDPRGHSCLVLGYAKKKPVHLVCGLTKQRKLIVITVYRPAMPKWLDERTRSR